MTAIVVFGVHLSDMTGMQKWLKQPVVAGVLRRHGVELRSKKAKDGVSGGPLPCPLAWERPCLPARAGAALPCPLARV